MLKDWFNDVMTSDGVSESERAGKCRALIELLRLRGQRVSAKAEQMFSTASNSAQQAPERLATLEARILTPKTPVVPKPKKRAQATSVALKVC